MKARGTRGGFTLVEVAIAATLLGIVLASVALTTSTLDRAFRASSVISRLDTEVSRTLDEVCRRLEEANRDSLSPEPVAPLSSSTVDFQSRVGFDASGILWGDVERIAAEPSPNDPLDGVDNDGNGLVDEHLLVWTVGLGTPDEKRRVLSRNVTALLAGETADGNDENGNGLSDEAGFCIAYDGDRAVIRLSLAALDGSGIRVVRTLERTLYVRNED